MIFDPYETFVEQLQEREYLGQKLGLERISKVLTRLGNPERKFPSIHVAGTNGKGSTAAMIASILKEAGYRTGLYTSPHLVDFCERVQILFPLITHPQPLSYIKRGEVLRYARMIHEVEEEPLTFFELATAIAFLHFAEQRVDIAVVEVGMGGRLDATNVITPLVSVITTIGLDHTQHLGDTLEKIAFEKAGIIKRGVPVVVGELAEEAMGVARRIAVERGAVLETVNFGFASAGPASRQPFELRYERSQRADRLSPARTTEKIDSLLSSNPTLKKGGIGTSGDHGGGILGSDHQLQNAAVAVGVVEELKKQGRSISDEAIQRGLEIVRCDGRLETIQEDPWILLDGAHNPQAMRAVREFLGPHLEGRRLKVLFGAMADKDLKGILAELSPITHEFIFTAFELKRAADPELLVQIGNSLGIKSRSIKGAGTAFERMKEALKKDEVLLVTGSFYLVGEIKKIIN